MGIGSLQKFAWCKTYIIIIQKLQKRHKTNKRFMPLLILNFKQLYFKASVANDLFSREVKRASAVSNAVNNGTFC